MESSAPSPLDLHFQLYPQQHDFVFCPTRYVGFVGGAGSGKTYAGCVKALLKALDCPGSAGAIVAPWYPMLRDVTKKTFLEVVPPHLVVYRNDSENRIGIRCANDQVSDVFFRSASDPDSLRGLNLVWFYMDEAALSPFDSFQILVQRLRHGNSKDQQGWVTSTPRGFNWLYDRFGPHVDNPNFRAFYAETKFNLFLGDEYLKDIYSQFKGSFALAELEGKFVAAEGLVYADLYDPKIHLGDYPFRTDWPVDLAWDFGYKNPEAVLAIQQDGKGNVFVIDELYHTNTLTEDIVAEAKGRPWFKNVVDCVCDDASPDSIVRLCGLGIPARPAKKGKVNEGIKLVRSLLSKDSVTQQPVLHIDRRCQMLDREFGLYQWADKNTMTDQYLDKVVKMHDHALDALRYWTVSKWSAVPNAVSVEGLHRPKPKRRVMSYMLVGRHR